MPRHDHITFRDAAPQDVELVFEWANDPLTRAASFQSDPIPYDRHVAWFTATLDRPDRHLLLAMAKGEPVAVLRFDADADPEAATISINVGPHTRGKGLGTATLQAANAEAEKLGFARIIAFIRPSNTASVRAFTTAGYVEVGQDTIHGQRALRFERTSGPTHG